LDNKLKKQLHYKDDALLLHLPYIHPILFFVYADMNKYCYEAGLPFVTTRILGEKIPGVSVSDTHKEGRAFDFSVRDWTDADIERFAEHFNNKYANIYGAYSYSDGLPRLAVFHNGKGWHFHIQIRRDL